jgi:oxygen-independent coproporphyrinogen-3 oxidase
VHLYVHIPFCHQACHYCDFHFSTHLAGKEAMVVAIQREIELQKDYLTGQRLETIYFGGGTPSLLAPEALNEILATIQANFLVESNAEITLEANPEDLTTDYLRALISMGINRLSIGIQSFQDRNLTFLNRNHSALQSIQAIRDAQEIGLTNISIDLIYGLPGNSLDDLEADIQQAIQTGVTHISAYSLTVEPKTVFGHQKKQGSFQEVPETHMAMCFELTHALLEQNGFEAYETSNFAKNGHFSRHNTSYWNQENYLGIGPAAHSFNQVSRQWNVANNAQYIKQIEKGIIPAEIEYLSPADQLNELMMTKFRTKAGVSLDRLKEKFAAANSPFPEYELNRWVSEGLAEIVDAHIRLIGNGKLIADKLASDLFVIDAGR